MKYRQDKEELITDITQKRKIMKFKVKLRILDKANELMEKQVWGSPSDALSDRRSVADCPYLSPQRACA